MKFIIIFILLISASCSFKETNANYRNKIGIALYSLNHDFKSKDSVFTEKKINNNNICFNYKYHRYKESPDTLIIYKDSIRFNTYHVWKLSEKEVIYKNKPLLISKYFSKQYTTSANIFINDSLGLIVTNNLATYNVVKYDTINLHEIHKQIIQDSLFFRYEF